MNRYRNFDLELFEHHRGDEGESLRCRVRASPAGEQRIADAERIALPGDLRTGLVRLEVRQLALEEMIALGEQLADLLLPPAVRRLFRRSQARLADDEGLRLRLRLDSPELADIPWEYAYLAAPDTPPDQKGPEGFLCLDRRLSMIRFEVGEEQPIRLKAVADGELTIVALLANPEVEGQEALDLRQEELDLRRSLEGLPNVRARFLHGGTVGELEEGLEEEAHVFHFAGHGLFERRVDEQSGEIEGSGALVLVDPAGGPEVFPADKLAGNLRGGGVRLAVLGACEAGRRDRVNAWSGVAPALTRGGIPAVVANQYDIDDASAVAFSQRFYRTLVRGQPIDAAVTNGRLAIFNRGGAAERDWGVPVLYLRADQSVLFPPHPGPLRANSALLGASLLLLIFWFSLHLYPFVAAKVSDWTRGAGLTFAALAFLWTAVKLLLPLFRTAAGERKRPLVESWLRRRWAGVGGLWLLTMAVFLNLTTTSVYLHHDGAAETGAVAVRVDRDERGSPFLPLPELRAEPGKVAGGALLLRGAWSDVRLAVESPRGYELAPAERRLRPWRSLQVRVSTDLERRDLKIFRLVPDFQIMSLLFEADPLGERGVSPYEARLTIDDGETLIFPDLHQGVLYLGGDEDLLSEAHEREDAPVREESLVQCLQLQAFRATMVPKWKSAQYWPTPELTDRRRIRVQIAETGSNDVLWDSQSQEIGGCETGSITNICLGREPGFLENSCLGERPGEGGER